MAQTEQANYFFVIEGDPPTLTSEVYARGQGLEVLTSLARISLLSDALSERESWDAQRLFPILHETTFDHVQRALEEESSQKPAGVAVTHLGTLTLSAIMHVASPESPLRQPFEGHLAKSLAGLRAGRPVTAAYDELMTLRSDIRRLTQASRFWFDRDGMRLTMPVGRETAEAQEQRLALRRVIRRPGDSGLDPETYEALFGALPKNAIPYAVTTILLNRGKSGRISLRRPFVHGELQRTYGYVPRSSNEFVPVVLGPPSLELTHDTRRI